MKKKLKKLKKPTIRKLKKELDCVFSIFIRQRGMDFQGYNSCYTCGVRKNWKELQCSHFVSRMHNNTRFDPMNSRPACMACNVFKHGALDVYAVKLVEENGVQILSELQKRKMVVKQWTRQELIQLIEKYENI